jgi:hypothetical protein
LKYTKWAYQQGITTIFIDHTTKPSDKHKFGLHSIAGSGKKTRPLEAIFGIEATNDNSKINFHCFGGRGMKKSKRTLKRHNEDEIKESGFFFSYVDTNENESTENKKITQQDTVQQFLDSTREHDPDRWLTKNEIVEGCEGIVKLDSLDTMLKRLKDQGKVEVGEKREGKATYRSTSPIAISLATSSTEF